jgi:hypothetical protein
MTERNFNNWGWHGSSVYDGAYKDWSFPGGYGLRHDTWYRIVLTVDDASSHAPKILVTLKTYEKKSGLLVNTTQILCDPGATGFLGIGARGGEPKPGPASGMKMDNFCVGMIKTTMQENWVLYSEGASP